MPAAAARRRPASMSCEFPNAAAGMQITQLAKTRGSLCHRAERTSLENRRAICVCCIRFCTLLTRLYIAQHMLLIAHNSEHRKNCSNYNLRRIPQTFGFAPAAAVPLMFRHCLLSFLTEATEVLLWIS